MVLAVSFGTTPLATSRAIRLMSTGVVDVEKVIVHRFSLGRTQEVLSVMEQLDRNKIEINP